MAPAVPPEEDRAEDAVTVVSVWYWAGPLALVIVILALVIWSMR